MQEELPDWSLLSYLFHAIDYISDSVGSQKDGAGKFAVGLVGATIAFCFAPIALGWFVLTNGFKVSSKTWFYALVMLTILVVIGIGSLFH